MNLSGRKNKKNDEKTGKQTNEYNFTKRNINEYKFEGKTYDRMFRMFL